MFIILGGLLFIIIVVAVVISAVVSSVVSAFAYKSEDNDNSI